MREIKYQTLEGKVTTSADPERGIWYGLCGMWTDDWTKINAGPPPHCPFCKGVGFQTVAREWFEGIKEYEKTHPGYTQEIELKREKCPRS